VEILQAEKEVAAQASTAGGVATRQVGVRHHQPTERQTPAVVAVADLRVESTILHTCSAIHLAMVAQG